MSLTHPLAQRQAIVARESAAIDAGGGANGTTKIWTGSPPGAGNAATGTLLGTGNLNATSFGAPNGSAVASMNGVPISFPCGATGTAGYFRHIASDGTSVVHEGTVG